MLGHLLRCDKKLRNGKRSADVDVSQHRNTTASCNGFRGALRSRGCRLNYLFSQDFGRARRVGGIGAQLRPAEPAAAARLPSGGLLRCWNEYGVDNVDHCVAGADVSCRDIRSTDLYAGGEVHVERSATDGGKRCAILQTS